MSCVSSTSCTAVGQAGNLLDASITYVTLAESRNGTDWSLETIPDETGNSGNTSDAEATWGQGVACLTTTKCLEVGFYQQYQESSWVTYAAESHA